jgi:hypothetical protein
MPQSFVFESFTKDLASKKHDLNSDKLKLALVSGDNPPTTSNSTLGDLKQIDMTHCKDVDLKVTGVEPVGAVTRVKIADKALHSAGGATGPFRYAVVYNDTSDDKCLIGMKDFGKDAPQTIQDGQNQIIHFDPDNGGVMIQATLP